MCENLNEVELAKFCDRSWPRDALIIQFYFSIYPVAPESESNFSYSIRVQGVKKHSPSFLLG